MLAVTMNLLIYMRSGWPFWRCSQGNTRTKNAKTQPKFIKKSFRFERNLSQGIKPECLNRVDDPEVFDLISSCIGPETERLTAQQIVNHPFLAIEPEVILLSNDEKKQLVIQVVSRGHEHLSVKFDFNGKLLINC